MDDHVSHSEHVASLVVGFMGSVRFLVIQTIVVVVWIIANVIWFITHFDPYPFILLNLLFSTQAAYAAPLILLSQNRAADRDRAMAQREANEVDDIDALDQETAHLIRDMHAMLKAASVPEPPTPAP